MAAPSNILPEAVTLMEERAWHWDGYYFAFRGARRAGESTEEYLRRPPDLVTYEEISDHGLTATGLSADERAQALDWLRQRLEQAV